jgi:hypothetical protein
VIGSLQGESTGSPFLVNLQSVTLIIIKHYLARDKDLKDIELIDEYLRNHI